MTSTQKVFHIAAIELAQNASKRWSRKFVLFADLRLLILKLFEFTRMKIS